MGPDFRPECWLVVQASAPLETVAATNYVCFGGAKVPRYGVTNPPPLPQDPAALCAEIIVRGPASGDSDGAPGGAADGPLRLAELDIRFRLMEQTERQVIWVWSDPARWWQVYWVWDFFRLLSHIVLRVGLPVPESVAPLAVIAHTSAESEPSEDTGPDTGAIGIADAGPAPAWTDLIAALRTIAPGDSLSVRVQSPCGNIHQVHQIAAAASEWRPPVKKAN